MQNVVVCLPDRSASPGCSARPSLGKIQVDQQFEIACDSVDTGTTVSEKLSSWKGPGMIIHLLPEHILPKDQPSEKVLDRVLLDSGITNDIVLNIQQREDGSYELVVAEPFLGTLSSKIHGFKIVTGRNPAEPSESNVRKYGIYKATREALDVFLDNAVDADRNGLPGAGECYEKVSGQLGHSIALQMASLRWDIQRETDQVREKFTQNLLFSCLNMFEHQDTPDTIALRDRTQEDWLRPFQDSAMAAHWKMKGSGLQAVSLFRSLLEYSGGRVDARQHKFQPDHTIDQNARLYFHPFGVPCSRPFGRFDPTEMHSALLNSKLFAEASSVPDTLEWSRYMMASIPIGFPDNYLNLPSQLLCRLGVEQVKLINIHFEQIYRQGLFLRRPENNISLLLTWSSLRHGQTLEVLRGWIKSEESTRLYQRLIKDFLVQETGEEFGLTLAALLCREQLLPSTQYDASHSIQGSLTADLDAIFSGQDIGNRRVVFEKMILSLLRVLNTFEDCEDTIRFLTGVPDNGISPMEPLEGFLDQYFVGRLHARLDHSDAYIQAEDKLSKSVDAWLMRDWHCVSTLTGS